MKNKEPLQCWIVSSRNFTFLSLFLVISLPIVVRFLISPKKKKMKIEVNKIMNPAFLLGTAFNIAYWHRKYHSGTICKGVSNQAPDQKRKRKQTSGPRFRS